VCKPETVASLKDALLQMLPSLAASQCSQEAPESVENESGGELEYWTDNSSCNGDSNIEHLAYLTDSLMRLLPALEDAMGSMVARQERIKTLLQSCTIAEIYTTIIQDKYPRVEPFRARILAQGVIDASDYLVQQKFKNIVTIGTQETSCPSISAFQDLGLGGSISKSLISDISELMTVTSSNKRNLLTIPPIPKPGAACPICLEKYPALTESLWR